MKNLIHFKKSVLTLFALILLVANSFASSEITLRLNLEKGKTTKYRTIINQKTTQSMGGMEQTVNQEQIFEYTISLIDKDNQGNQNAEITYTRIAIDMSAQGMSFSFDSNDEDQSASLNPQFMGFAALVDKSINAKFSPKGEILEISGVEEMLEQMLDDMTSGDEGRKAQMKQMMAGSFNEETMKQMFGGASLTFPEKSLKIGSSWTENQSIVNQFTINVMNTYTVKSIEGNDVSVDISSTISTVPGNKTNMQGMDVTFNLFGTQSGNLKISTKTGEVNMAEINQSITGKMLGDMAGQTMEVPMSITSKTTTEKL